MDWERIREEYETTKITLKALAEKHDIKLGTLKSRKSREGWSRDATATPKKVATKKKKDATKKKHGGQIGNRGNPNPANQFPKRNRAALKHGLYSRYIPEETLEIMDFINDADVTDLLWHQIQLQYTAIIRAQEIMFVTDKSEMIKELKKSKFEVFPKKDGTFEQIPVEEEYNFQFAWERQAQFLTAQSRAIGELRNAIKQFDEIAHVEDERRLKLEGMRLNAEKTRAEIDKISNGEDDGPIEIMIKRAGEG